MCEFASWIKHNEKPYFLTNSDLQTKTFEKFKKFNLNWKEDICGHGAILYFYPELKGKNISKEENIDFSTPNNFPKELVKAIKLGKMRGIGVALGLLNEKGQNEYQKINQSALAEY